MILFCKTEITSTIRLSQACSCCRVAKPEQMDILFILIISQMFQIIDIIQLTFTNLFTPSFIQFDQFSSIQWIALFLQYCQLKHNSQMIYQQSSWRPCFQHQQQIAILQDKLRQNHNKLIDQLDICKQQELIIINLNNKIKQINNNYHHFDAVKYQSFGINSLDQSSKENQINNYKMYQHNDSYDSYKTKAELLKADLQAMRNKVLTQITQKDRLREELKEIKCMHRKQINLQMKKLQGLENSLKKLKQENKELKQENKGLKQKYEGMRKKNNKHQPQFDNLLDRINQLENRHGKQKEINRELLLQNKMFADKIDDLQRELYEQRYNQTEQKKIYYDDYHQNTNYREKQTLKNNKTKEKTPKKVKRIERDQKQTLDYRQQREKVQRVEEKRKRNGFQQTKQLIKKLEQAQVNMRKNRKLN